jgi:hypothetical protein
MDVDVRERVCVDKGRKAWTVQNKSRYVYSANACLTASSASAAAFLGLVGHC